MIKFKNYYIGYDPFDDSVSSGFGILGAILCPDSEEFKKRYIENPEWKKTKLKDEIKELQSRERSHRDMAQYYTRIADGVADDIKNKEKELQDLK